MTSGNQTSRNNQHTCQERFELYFPILEFAVCESSDFSMLNLAHALQPPLPPSHHMLTHCCFSLTTSSAATTASP